jgi:hypothetical protein
MAIENDSQMRREAIGVALTPRVTDRDRRGYRSAALSPAGSLTALAAYRLLSRFAE